MPARTAIAISLLLHVVAVVALEILNALARPELTWLATKHAETSVQKKPQLQIRLVSRATPRPTKPSRGYSAESNNKGLPDSDVDDSASSPRFLIGPNWAQLDRLVKHTHFEATIRIHVSASGLATSVSVLESTPLSDDVLEELRLALYQAGYSPAMRNNRPVAGQFEIILGARD